MSRADLPSISGKLDRDTRAPEQPAIPAEAGDDESFSPYRFIHQHLRGRYLVAIGLGLLCAAAFAVVGWYSTEPKYRSEALLRIAYEQQRVLQASPDYKPMEVYEAFMQSQVALLGSYRLLSKATEQPIWAERNFKMDASWVEALAEGLNVEHRAGSENLKVSFASDNPLFAATAVRATVDAYTKLYNEMDLQSNQEKTVALESRKAELTGIIDKAQVLLRDESAAFGTSNIDRFYENAVASLTRIESSLIDVRIALAMAQPKIVGGQAVVRFTPQQIARFDPTMARYVADREALEMKLQQLRMRGLGEGHKDVKETRDMLEFVAQRIRDSAVEFQDSGASVPAAATLPPAAGAAVAAAAPGLVGRSADELRSFEANLSQLSKEAKDQLTTVGAKKLKIESIRADIDKNKTELADVIQKLSSMQIESGLSGRLSVMSNGEVPLLPFQNRRVHLAGIGAVGGMAIPAAVMIGVGFIRKRYRDSMDAADDLAKDVPLLGILPQLPARLTDPESAADAAQCLHQIRVMLQVQQPAQGEVTYLLTSSCPGEGKTSLCAALALSFAAAGARTLVIDADLIGQRLTRGYRMDDKPGFREAMEGGRKSVPFYPTGIKHLSILPAGISDGRDACSVSSKMVKRLLHSVREEFDVVLVDSGPILGSLEALVLAQHVDGVIMTISREQQKPLVDRALRQLRSVRAKIAGMVFNKAESADFKRSVGPSSLRSIPRNAESGVLVKAGMTSTSGFGSLVDSVQTFMPETSPA